MANAITHFKKYIDMLDTVYQQASATSILDADADTVRMGAKAGEFLIPKISMNGLADFHEMLALSIADFLKLLTAL